jgi:hypothetical protein
MNLLVGGLKGRFPDHANQRWVLICHLEALRACGLWISKLSGEKGMPPPALFGVVA